MKYCQKRNLKKSCSLLEEINIRHCMEMSYNEADVNYIRLIGKLVVSGG